MLSVESIAAAEIEPIVGKLRREIYPSHGEANGGTADVIGHRIAHHFGCYASRVNHSWFGQKEIDLSPKSGILGLHTYHSNKQDNR